jgi:hypothetical protein
MKAHRSMQRKHKGRALLVLDMTAAELHEMTAAELHEIEMHARVAGLSVEGYAARTLLAGDRLCEHGVSVLAVDASACVRCWGSRRAVARAAMVALAEEE